MDVSIYGADSSRFENAGVVRREGSISRLQIPAVHNSNDVVPPDFIRDLGTSMLMPNAPLPALALALGPSHLEKIIQFC